MRPALTVALTFIALAGTFAAGRASRKPLIVTKTETVEVERKVEIERKVPEVRTERVAGPVRTVVRRERVLVPGKGCEEVTTTTREEAPVETRTESKGGEVHVAAAEKTREHIVTVAAPLPRWSLEARVGVPLRFDGATLGMRVIGPVWAVAGVSGWKPVVGARVTW